MHRVVITGIGIIAPIGADTPRFWSNCLAGVSSAAPIPEAWMRYGPFTSKIWAPLPEIDFAAWGINRIERMQNDMTALLAMAAARQTLDMAGVHVTLCNEKKNAYILDGLDAQRCGVFIGTAIGGITSFSSNQGHHLYAPVQKALGPGAPPQSSTEASNPGQMRLLRLLQYSPRFHPFAASMSMPNTAAASVGIKYSLRGPNMTLANACAAGTAAIGRAFLAIQSGEADCALAGGVEFLRDDYGGIFRAFDIARTLAVAGAHPLQKSNRPFDADRTGFLFSAGGCGILLIESADHAKSRGIVPLAQIRSFSETFDASSMMSPEPSGREMERMVRLVLDKAGLHAEDIGYINAHGTGTRANDAVEAQVMERVFGTKPLVNATKSLIGHAMGAAGAIEAGVTALSIRDQTTHVCNNLKTPVRPLRFVQKVRPCCIEAALTQSFAFGGHNAALVLSRC